MHAIGEGNGNPLQYICLENPRDRGAWWAAVYGVEQSWTRLRQLSSSSMHSGRRIFQDFVLTNKTESLRGNFPAIQDVCHLLGSPTFHFGFLERSWGIQYREVCCGFLCSQFLE